MREAEQHADHNELNWNRTRVHRAFPVRCRYNRAMRLADRTVIVTGGASGLGGATVDMVVAAGGRAVIVDVNENAGRDKAAAHGERVRFVAGDVTRERDVRQAVAAAHELGGVHGLVNAAGVATAERVLPKDGIQPLEHFVRTIQINLVGSFNAIRLAAAAMAANEPTDGGERGVIVNTASVAAFDGQIGQAAYAASKGGIVSMTLPIAREFARMGVRVMTIAPGTFDTPLLAGLPEAARQSLAQQVPFPSRLGRPEEYAALVRHIFENEMLNGEVIRLDGAIRMAPK
jgi:NAD(P)-dependent dehydrogenase (short-subunit alcohol dehydrogenase family)